MPIDNTLGMPYDVGTMNEPQKLDKEACRIIEALGGTNKVAALCDIKPPSVTGWKREGIPKPWLKYFQAIRPDVFGDKRKVPDRRRDRRNKGMPQP